MTSRPSTAAPILAVLAIVLPIALYVGGYYSLGEMIDWRGARISYLASSMGTPKFPQIVRTYSYEWLAAIYRPAGSVEAWLRGTEVDIKASASSEDRRPAP